MRRPPPGALGIVWRRHVFIQRDSYTQSGPGAPGRNLDDVIISLHIQLLLALFTTDTKLRAMKNNDPSGNTRDLLAYFSLALYKEGTTLWGNRPVVSSHVVSSSVVSSIVVSSPVVSTPGSRGPNLESSRCRLEAPTISFILCCFTSISCIKMRIWQAAMVNM